MIDDTFKKMMDFLNSEEGEKSIKEFGEKMKREDDRRDRWIEKFKELAESDIDSALSKIIEKYDSDEYVKREYSLGYEPRETLLWIAFGYASKYCKECTDEKYLNMFTDGAYYIGSYVIQVMNGQGSVIKIEKI
jgi:hypothetical protein